MATVSVDLTGLDRLRWQMRAIANPKATPLMRTWMRIIAQDNKEGVMAGTDKDGNPMPPVTYRPVGEAQQKLTDAQRNTNNRRLRRGNFIGRGPAASGWNNNLTRKQYEKLDGPALAPRGYFPRVITNLLTGFTTPTRATNAPGESAGQWSAIGYWEGVVSTNGTPFLMAHFTGAAVGRNHAVTLPTRDLRGVRPEGKRRAKEAMREWMVDQIRKAGESARSASAEALAESAGKYLDSGGGAGSNIDLGIFNLD